MATCVLTHSSARMLILAGVFCRSYHEVVSRAFPVQFVKEAAANDH